MANQDQPQSDWKSTRFFLAVGLTAVSVCGVIALSWVIIVRNSGEKQISMQVLTTVLPLIGTWVGTVMAYYFSRENFEAASRSAAELARQLTPQEKLRSTVFHQPLGSAAHRSAAISR